MRIGDGSSPAIFVALSLLVAVVVAAFYYFPYQYGWVVSEDDVGESITFAAFGLAAAAFLYLAIKVQSPRRYWFTVFAAGCIVAAGEEVSWGQRFVGVPTPDFIREHNVQGEMNLHNLDDDALFGLYLAGTFAILLLGVAVPILKERSSRVRAVVEAFDLPAPPLRLAPLFAAPFGIWAFTEYAGKDEVVELFVGLALAAFAADRLYLDAASAVGVAEAKPRRNGWIAAALLLCAAGGLITMRISDPPKGLEQTLLTNATLLLPRHGYFEQAERLFEQLEERTTPEAKTGIRHEKARFLAARGRTAEARALFEQVIAEDSRRLAEDPGQLSIRIRLLEAHVGAGNRRQAESLHAAIEAHVREQLESVDAGKKSGSDRPEWARHLWDHDAREADKKARLLIHLGDASAELGYYERSIDEFLMASEFATWGNTKWFLNTRYASVVERCLGSEAEDLETDAVEEALAKGVNLCRQEPDPMATGGS